MSRLESYADWGDVILTDAAVNPGNSGGPLLNECGQIVGMTVAGYTDAEGINYAIAETTLRQRITELGGTAPDASPSGAPLRPAVTAPATTTARPSPTSTVASASPTTTLPCNTSAQALQRSEQHFAYDDAASRTVTATTSYIDRLDAYDRQEATHASAKPTFGIGPQQADYWGTDWDAYNAAKQRHDAALDAWERYHAAYAAWEAAKPAFLANYWLSLGFPDFGINWQMDSGWYDTRPSVTDFTYADHADPWEAHQMAVDVWEAAARSAYETEKAAHDAWNDAKPGTPVEPIPAVPVETDFRRLDETGYNADRTAWRSARDAALRAWEDQGEAHYEAWFADAQTALDELYDAWWDMATAWQTLHPTMIEARRDCGQDTALLAWIGELEIYHRESVQNCQQWRAGIASSSNRLAFSCPLA